MPNPSSRLDLYGESDPRTNRYAWALGRAVPLIVAAAVVGGALLALAVGGAEHRTTTTFGVSPASTTLASVGFAEDLEKIPAAFDAMQFLLGPREEFTDRDVSVTATLDVTNDQAVIFTVSGDSDAAVQDATAAYLSALDKWIGDRRSEATAELQQVVADQRAALEARREELDGEIAGLASSEALRDAFLDERATLTTSILQADTQTRALTGFVNAPRVDVLTSATGSSDSRVVFFVIGAVLGGVLAAAVVLLVAHADRRVRSRSDLAAVTDAPILPVIPAAGTEREPALGAAAVAAQRASTNGVVLIVPADDNGSRTLASALAERIPDATVFSPRVDGAAPEVGGAAIVVAGARSSTDDVARTVQYLDALGCTTVGALLGDVPARQVRRASS